MPVATTAPRRHHDHPIAQRGHFGHHVVDTRMAQPGGGEPRDLARGPRARSSRRGRWSVRRTRDCAGSCTSARARARRRRSPSDSDPASREASGTSPSWSSSLVDPRGPHPGGDALQVGAVFEVLANGEVIVDADVFRNHAEPARAAIGCAATWTPSTSTRPRVGTHQAGDRTDGGGLAGAVRAEQRRDRSIRHLERHAVDRGRRPERLANVVDGNHGVSPRGADDKRRPRHAAGAGVIERRRRVRRRGTARSDAGTQPENDALCAAFGTTTWRWRGKCRVISSPARGGVTGSWPPDRINAGTSLVIVADSGSRGPARHAAHRARQRSA